MEIRLIARSEASRRVDGVYNHPSAINDEFAEEYRQSVMILAAELTKIGTVSVDGESTRFDFLLSTDDAFTRSIFVVCFHPHVFSALLLDHLRASLSAFRQRYLIIVDGRFSHADPFYLFVEKDKVEGWFKSPEKQSVFQ